MADRSALENPKHCDLHGAQMSTLPKLEGVREFTLKEFLRIAAGNVTVDDKYPLPKILDSEGRCIRVQVTGTRLNWHQLAEGLLGTGRPCEEFRVEGNFINARLKTSEQLTADDLASDIDEKYCDTRLQTYWPFFEDGPSGNTRQLGQTKGKKPVRDIPEGAATDVMKAMKLHCALGSISTDELLALTKKAMPKRLDAQGFDRRNRYIRNAIARLVSLEFLYVKGEDQDELSLSPLILEEDDADTDA